MTDRPTPEPEEIRIHNQESLEELAWAIEASEGQFSLLLARCNYVNLRERLIEQLQAMCALRLHVMRVQQSSKTLYTRIREEMERETIAALLIVGLEGVADVETMFASVNSVREEFRKNFPFPIVLWVTDGLHRQLLQRAPDLESWATTVPFSLPPRLLQTELQNASDRLYATVLQPNSPLSFRRLLRTLDLGFLQTSEIERAVADLRQAGHTPSAYLQATLNFVQGLSAATNEAALEYFRRSLRFWEGGEGIGVLGESGERGERGGSLAISEAQPSVSDTQARGSETQPRVLNTQAGESDTQPSVSDTQVRGLETLSPAFETQPQESESPPGASDTQPQESDTRPPVPGTHPTGSETQPPVVESRSPAAEAQTHATQTPSATPEAQPLTPTSPSSPISPTAPTSLFPLPSPTLVSALLLYFIGRTLYDICNANKHREVDWEPPVAPLQECLRLFEQANRLDLVAKCITQLERVMDRREAWDELAALVAQSLPLQQTCSNLSRSSQDYRYRAKVALHQGQVEQAHADALQALTLVQQVPEDTAWEGLYLLTLAQTLRAQGRHQEALDRLIEARSLGDRGIPRVYIGVLEELRSCYLHRKDYLQAFQIRQERLSVEQVYGIRAFVGAGRLRAERVDREQLLYQTRNLVKGDSPDALVAPVDGVAAWQRQRDVKRLLERIGRNDCKLIVIHGYSGVGKSSLISAGLIPALEQKAIGFLTNRPILIRKYTDWQTELSHHLPPDSPTSPSPPASPTPDSLLTQLRLNEQRNLRTILIFDQFEEFFFVHPTPVDRRPFFTFLGLCMQIPTVKVVLPLREDYLYYLLEFNRVPEIALTGIDTLSRNVLYPLGNFSPADARTIIEELTNRARFYLEPDLVDELVQDLTDEMGEVRPVELQIVGAQLQTDNIRDRLTYLRLRESGRPAKEVLVERYLADVVNDCGADHSELAERVLFLLTDEKGTRPLKTRAELEKELSALALEPEPERLDLVLKVLVGSGLVMFLPEMPDDRYQLVHDYLADFIRQQQMPMFIEELSIARQQKAQSEAQLLQALAQLEQSLKQEQNARQQAEQLRINAEKNEIEALCKSSEALFASDQMFDALLESLRAAVRLKQTIWMQGEGSQIEENRQIKFLVEKALRQSVYAVKEFNRFETFDLSSLPPLAKGILTLNAATNFINEGGSAIVWSVCFSPDGQLLATASNDGTIKLWRVNGSLFKVLPSYSISRWVRFSPDGQMLVSAHDDSCVRLWKLDGTPVSLLEGHSDEISQVCFSPDGQMIASASFDGTVKLWSLDGVLLHTISSHAHGVKAVSFSPDGQLIASASNFPQDSCIRLWNRKGEFLTKLSSQGVICFCFCPDGKTILTSDGSSIVKLIDLDGNTISSFEGHNQQVFNINFSPDGKTIATASSEGTVKLWDINGNVLRTLQHSSSVNDVSFSPNGYTLASACIDGRVSLWKAENPLHKTIRGEKNQWFQSLCFSPDDKFIATGDNNGIVQFWNLSGILLSSVKAHEDRVSTIRISSDSQKFITASFDKTVKLWRIDGTLLQIFQHNEKVLSVEFSPDEETFVGGGTETAIRLWHQNGNLLNEMNNQGDQYTESVSFSPDGQLIAVGTTGGTVDLWKSDGTFIRSLKGHGRAVMSTSFSSDGELILSASRDNTAKIWSRDGELRKTFQGHRNWVMDAEFSPDCKVFATASFDRTVRVWSLGSQRRAEQNSLIAEFQGHEDLVWEVCFSPDGKILASASKDGTVILWNWNLKLDELIAQGCNWLRDYFQTNPNLEDSDRQLYNSIRQRDSNL
jgi:WD40 repeat protein/tetratricopeptide (TPR) repeat protein